MLLIFKILFVVVFLDYIYLHTNSNYFMNLVKDIQGSKLEINIYSALFCYICIIFMLYYFIIKEKKSVKDAFLLGLCTYGIFEFTNMTIFTRWSSYIIYVDIIWGGILYALTTYIIQNNFI